MQCCDQLQQCYSPQNKSYACDYVPSPSGSLCTQFKTPLAYNILTVTPITHMLYSMCQKCFLHCDRTMLHAMLLKTISKEGKVRFVRVLLQYQMHMSNHAAPHSQHQGTSNHQVEHQCVCQGQTNCGQLHTGNNRNAVVPFQLDQRSLTNVSEGLLRLPVQSTFVAAHLHATIVHHHLSISKGALAGCIDGFAHDVTVWLSQGCWGVVGHEVDCTNTSRIRIE